MQLAINSMKRTFFIVGPTATGKSELAADVAREIGAEIVSADAFQIYRGLDLLTAKPDASTLDKAPHHLIGTTPLHEEMNAEKLAPLPESDPKLRERLNAMSLDELHTHLAELDPEAAQKIDLKNRRRVVRAVEICLRTGMPVSEVVSGGADPGSLGKIPPRPAPAATGVFVFRDREELYARINQRVEAMFENDIIEQVRTAGEVSVTASQMIGFREIHQLLDGKMSISQCIAAIQQATRRYAKRQLTWFRRQTNFSALNLSLLTHNEALILLRMLSERRKVSRVRAKG